MWIDAIDVIEKQTNEWTVWVCVTSEILTNESTWILWIIYLLLEFDSRNIPRNIVLSFCVLEMPRAVNKLHSHFWEIHTIGYAKQQDCCQFGGPMYKNSSWKRYCACRQIQCIHVSGDILYARLHRPSLQHSNLVRDHFSHRKHSTIQHFVQLLIEYHRSSDWHESIFSLGPHFQPTQHLNRQLTFYRHTYCVHQFQHLINTFRNRVVVAVGYC